ncbi:hypothetical protein GN244_ATG12382 [Phytophthora infestans]|uniref:Uncharacterized protein n=1 Tax=Phytophthora infestans TaxID=4787 RepID=A0A833WHW5_PHYIN|nr:hypothetical protein GN244_ATG12382 [Phytophthora infestans]KAF4139333.1 hypothetical protein GN958_ATG11480 [Phytophthora infestans]
MQTRLKYFVKMPGDQSTCFLTKSGTRFKFVKVSGRYRLWSLREQQKEQTVVYSAIVKPKKSISLPVWHKRFAHASEATILDMTKKMLNVD